MKMTTNSLLKSLWEEEISESTCAEISELGTLLQQVSTRAAEIDDPKLNALMCQLGLYSIADPASPDYDPEAVARVISLANCNRPFGEALKSERLRLELTQKGAAHILCVSERTYHAWERAEDRMPSQLTQEGAIERLRKIPNASAAFQQVKGAEA